MFVSIVSTLLLAQAGTAAAPAGNTKVALDAQVRATFTRLDTNKDGYVDRAEADAAMNAGLTARQAQVRKARDAEFTAIDTNKDGSISRQEFAMVGAPKAPATGHSPWLDRNDIDKNGRVALAEALAKATNGFDLLDTDKNGTISPAEVRAARAKRAPRK
jgi:hypothetical protein